MINDSAQADLSDDASFDEFRAPSRHGTALIVPSLENAKGNIDDNVALAAKRRDDWADLANSGREHIVQSARKYTSAYRSVESLGHLPDQPIVMAGHQPALFHPGVWFKNFALSRIASQTGALAINLVVDNDVASASAIRVPTLDRSGLRYESVAFDQASGGVPYEQTQVTDRIRFDRFDLAVADAVRPLVDNPSVRQLWPYARAAVDRCGFAGCALAQARHALEADLGLQTLEVPTGVMCRSIPFAAFALKIMSDLPRFHQCYNDSADGYRIAHGIRSTAHPVPNLQRQEEWLEAPFWLYGNQSPQRRSVWVRSVDSGAAIEISDQRNRLVKIDRPESSSAAEQFYAAMTPEFKFRSRALVTTMYSRLVLSDLFLHGIGGGKYDQLGDRITERFFGFSSPAFMVLSATVKLPGANESDYDALVQSAGELKRQIRATRFQPECFVDRANLEPGLLALRQQLIDQIPPRGKRLTWHREISSVTSRLAEQLQEVRDELSADLQEARRRLQSESIRQSREHAFCVFPMQYLTGVYDDLLGNVQ